jgi:hypothetical protein
LTIAAALSAEEDSFLLRYCCERFILTSNPIIGGHLEVFVLENARQCWGL